MTSDPFELVERFGTRVVRVNDLPRPVLYLPEYGMALVASDLDAEGIAWAQDWLMTRTCQAALEPRR